MSPGMATEKKGDPSFKLLRIPEAYRDRYRQQQPKDQQKNSDLVQLQCSSCHQLDAGDFGIKGGLGELPAVALLPARAKGAYMLPIAYENQCQACHPLTFERTIKDKPLSGEIAVRHRIQGDEVHQYLTGHYTAKALDEKFQAFEKFIPVRPKPGKLLGEEAEPVRKAIRNKVRSAEQLLFSANTCGKCHTYETSKKGAAPRIKPAAIKDVWLENARFSHKAHRAADCRACHARAYPDSKDASDLSSDVMIPGIDTCLQCHAPPTQAGGKLRGGARFDCTECHRYHNGDHSREGVGAGRRAPRKPRDVDRLLLNLGDE
jgi:nitrate/TMAO reductase-like tetraheme cytochrome c subunit